MTVNLNENEYIDKVPGTLKSIIQNKKKFCYGIDAVLLASFTKVKGGDKVMDLCSGNGIIPLILGSKNTDAFFTGIEIQKDVCDMASRSIALNDIQNINMICSDLKDCIKTFDRQSFNTVTVNPPYMKNEGRITENPSKAIARHEVMCTIDDIARVSSHLLRDGGSLYMIHRPFRLTQIMEALNRYRLECKEIRFVYPDYDSDSTMVLIHCIKNAKAFVQVQKPLYIYRDKNIYTDEVLSMY